MTENGQPTQKFHPLHADKANIDDSQAPSQPSSVWGTLGMLASRLKAITGRSTWRDDPPTNLTEAKAHHDNQSNPHGVTLEQIGALSDAYVPQWDDIEGKPASYPSSWNEVSGKPSSFAPSPHKSSHSTGGADALSPADIRAGYSERVYRAPSWTDQTISAASSGWQNTILAPEISVPALGAAPAGYKWLLDIQGFIRVQVPVATSILIATSFNRATSYATDGGGYAVPVSMPIPIQALALNPPSEVQAFTINFLLYVGAAGTYTIRQSPFPAARCYLVEVF